MELNKKIMRNGMILIGVFLMLNIAMVFIYRLEEPVFLKMYIEEEVRAYDSLDSMNAIPFRYITNKTDKRKIRDIVFEEDPRVKVNVLREPNNGLSFYFNTNMTNENVELCGRYAIHSIRLQLYLDEEELEGNFNEIELKEARIFFDDNSYTDMDLGSIVLHKSDVRNNHIGFSSVSSSSTGISEFRGSIKEDIRLLEVKSKLLKYDKTYFDMFIGEKNYKDISQVNYKVGQPLIIQSEIKTPEDIEEKYAFFDIQPKVYYEDMDGQIFYKRIHNIDYEPDSFSIVDIIKYLKARGTI